MATSPRCIVFVGPSAPRADRPTSPAIQWRAPIRRGDLDDLPDSIRCVGIVDGEFDQALAVAPREILALLRRGVAVLGASSMGALRAAELSDLGMRGVGRIFEMYRDEEVTADDEVAVIYDSESQRALSEPLVNIRCSVRRAVEEGDVTPAEARLIVEAAAALLYPDRAYPRVLADAGARVGRSLAGLAAALARHDQKRLDAGLLFRAVLETVNEAGVS